MDAMLTEVTEMNAAVLYGQEDVRIERVPMPRPEAGEIVVEVQAALTCGTDLKTYRRGYHAKMLALPALFPAPSFSIGMAPAEFCDSIRHRKTRVTRL